MLSTFSTIEGNGLPDTGPYRRIIPCLDVTGGRVAMRSFTDGDLGPRGLNTLVGIRG